jgi:hypothetical protein
MVVIRVQDGEEDFELFAMGTIRVKDGEEDALVLMRSDCWMGLRGWEGLRLTGSYETGVEFSHPRNGMVRGQVRERCFDGIGCRMDMRGQGAPSARHLRGRAWSLPSEDKERCFDVN